MDRNDIKCMEEELEKLKNELSDRNAALPAHSVRPHQILEIEELEERVKELENKIKAGQHEST
jgi:predicted patatin/cPLA2 family phospholipase